MKIKPVLTEKSLEAAKSGWYTFRVNWDATKSRAKKAIEELFDVHVKKIRTVSMRKRRQRDNRGHWKTIKGYKKAVVRLAEKEKIDIFEEGVKKGK